jgi:hypothetical protein
MHYDSRRMYRKHAVGETVTETGEVVPTYAVDGPYSLAFRPGSAQRTAGPEGYTYEASVSYIIAHMATAFRPGDILTEDPHGNVERYKVEVVKSYPTEQQLYARAL